MTMVFLFAPLVVVAFGIVIGYFLRWLSPLGGAYGSVQREMTLLRTLEREITRSLRHGAPLIIAVLAGKRRLPLLAIARTLRTSDLVFRGYGRHLVVVLTETSTDQGRLVLERLIARFPVAAAAFAEVHCITPAQGMSGFGARHGTRATALHGPTVALLRGLRLGIFRARLQAVPLYEVTSADIQLAIADASATVVTDLTSRVA